MKTILRRGWPAVLVLTIGTLGTGCVNSPFFSGFLFGAGQLAFNLTALGVGVAVVGNTVQSHIDGIQQQAEDLMSSLVDLQESLSEDLNNTLGDTNLADVQDALAQAGDKVQLIGDLLSEVNNILEQVRTIRSLVGSGQLQSQLTDLIGNSAVEDELANLGNRLDSLHQRISALTGR